MNTVPVIKDKVADHEVDDAWHRREEKQLVGCRAVQTKDRLRACESEWQRHGMAPGRQRNATISSGNEQMKHNKWNTFVQQMKHLQQMKQAWNFSKMFHLLRMFHLLSFTNGGM